MGPAVTTAAGAASQRWDARQSASSTRTAATAAKRACCCPDRLPGGPDATILAALQNMVARGAVWASICMLTLI